MRQTNKGLRLLIADDHETVRRGIAGILRAHRRWKVVGEALDGQEAVDKARQLQPDVAILDITMPKIDGLEASRQIREAAPRVKTLVLTMHESGQMVQRVLQAGALGYVLKSDLSDQLVRAVQEVSQGKQFLSSRASQLVVRGLLKESKNTGRIMPTRRETDIIRHLVEAKSNKQISALLGMSIRTVETLRARVMMKLGVHSLAELIHYAISNGIVSLPHKDGIGAGPAT